MGTEHQAAEIVNQKSKVRGVKGHSFIFHPTAKGRIVKSSSPENSHFGKWCISWPWRTCTERTSRVWSLKMKSRGMDWGVEARSSGRQSEVKTDQLCWPVWTAPPADGRHQVSTSTYLRTVPLLSVLSFCEAPSVLFGKLWSQKYSFCFFISCPDMKRSGWQKKDLSYNFLAFVL